jgi:hypothetical protein
VNERSGRSMKSLRRYLRRESASESVSIVVKAKQSEMSANDDRKGLVMDKRNVLSLCDCWDDGATR